MKKILYASSAFAALLSPVAAQETTPLTDVIIVSGSQLDPASTLSVTPGDHPGTGADLTQLAARVPGGARIGNGALSGQMQYRGLFGERLNLRVDGQRFASGGPNLMDPAFHYAPLPLIAALVVDRGVSPVSEGPGLAGGADAIFKKIGYAEGPTPQLGYDLTLGGQTVNDSHEVGGIIGTATDRWRLNALGSYEKGDDTDYADGTIGGSAYERGVYGLSAGARLGVGDVSLDLRRQNTGPSGNPAFPMDIRYFDTDFARLSFERPFGEMTIRASLHYTDVSHAMTNFSLRPAPLPAKQRETYAAATTKGADLELETNKWGGVVLVGVDSETSDHNSVITNPNNADFYVAAFPDIETRRLGFFTQWTGGIGALEGEIGLRLDQYDQQAGLADVGPALPMGPRMLASQFNASGRTANDTAVDGVARLWTDTSQPVSWRLTLARKTALPGYIQRYGWLPINASGGLADGNIYVGDVALKPEKATIAEIGFDYQTSRSYARPTVFLRQIDDYIQGTPFDGTPAVADTPQEMIATMGGGPNPASLAQCRRPTLWYGCRSRV